MELEDLNDDCLLCVFDFLQPEDLLALEEVSTGLRFLAYQFYRLVRSYEWTKARQKVNSRIIERVGGNLRKLVYHGIGSTDLECFSAVNDYCKRITTLILYDVTVDSNLTRLLMPILDHLNHLSIDRYLMVKKLRVEGPLNEGEEPPETDEEPELTDIQCLMLCASNLKHLFIGEPFDKDSFMSHEYLSTLLNLRSLNLNLTRNESFAEFGEYFSHTFLPLEELELIFPNEGVTDYDLFCKGLCSLEKLSTLKLHNLKNKHFDLLLAGIKKVKSLLNLVLDCAQGVNFSKSVQQQLMRFENKSLRHVSIKSIKNSSLQFLWPLKWWKYLQSFEIENCESFKDSDLLEICTRTSDRFVSMTVKDCPRISPELVHLLVRISKIRKYGMSFHFYHPNQETFSKFEKETNRTILRNILVYNYLSE